MWYVNIIQYNIYYNKLYTKYLVFIHIYMKTILNDIISKNIIYSDGPALRIYLKIFYVLKYSMCKL